MRSALAIVSTLLALGGVTEAQEIRPTLERMRESGVIHLGHRETSPPFSFLDKDRKPSGYSVDLCRQIVAALRQSPELAAVRDAWVPVTPADRIGKLVKGAVDVECGSSTITFSRMEQVSFSHMIFVDGASLLATAESRIAQLADLGGKRVGVVRATTTEKALAAGLKRLGLQAQVTELSDHAEGLRGLESGQLDAYASDRQLLAGLLAQAKDPGRLRLSGELFSVEPYGLMLRRGDSAFRARVNRALSALYRSGEIVPIYERWFGPWAKASPLVQAMYQLHSIPE
jgi:glutamate/aspartate transport system substrate-binding protein